MKKHYIFLFIALLVGSSSVAGIVINGTFTIGRKNHNCTGLSICSAVATTLPNTEGMVNGTLDFDEERGSLIIGINKQDLLTVQPDKMIYFDNKSEVLFADDFVLSDEIRAAVHTTKPLIIRKGEYSLTLKNGKYYIEIPL